MNDDRDTIYGKLRLVTNISQLMRGPTQQVVLSTNQGRLPPYLAPTTTREQHNFVTKFYEDQQYWLDNVNVEKIGKKFIISIVNAVYLEPLWEPRFEYKGKSLRQFLDLLINEFQATHQ